MSEIKIRIAGLKDSLEIAGLMSRLGYPTSSDEMKKRLAAIRNAFESAERNQTFQTNLEKGRN